MTEPPPSGMSAAWTVNTSRGVVQGGPWGSLWRSRELIGYFSLRDLRLRYRQAVLGVAWVLAQPIASVAVFTVVFSHLADVGSQGVAYPLFALVGIVTWTYFSSTVVSATTVLVANANLVTKVYFPRMAAPAAALIPAGVDLAVSLLFIGAVATWFGVFAGLNLLAVPLWLLFLVLTAFGIGLWLSALNVRYRDVQHAVTPVLQLWLFASPVAYPATLLSGWQDYVYALNPMAGVIGLGRWALLSTAWPGWPLAVSVASTLLILITGLRYFSRAQRSFADVI